MSHFVGTELWHGAHRHPERPRAAEVRLIVAAVASGQGLLTSNAGLDDSDWQVAVVSPDFIPVLGYLDDVILIPLGLALAVKLTPPEILASAQLQVKEAANKPVSYTAAGFIVLLWLAYVLRPRIKGTRPCEIKL